MNKDKLYSLVPKLMVQEDEVNSKIEEQREIINNGEAFLSRLSINRYLSKPLKEFDIEQRLNLFLELPKSYSCMIYENHLFGNLDIESFASILENEFKIDDMYMLDNYYIEKLLTGEDITQQTVTVIESEEMFNEVLNEFVFQCEGMMLGDEPPLNLMLVVKKALLGTHLAKKNIEALSRNKREIFDISILM